MPYVTGGLHLGDRDEIESYISQSLIDAASKRDFPVLWKIHVDIAGLQNAPDKNSTIPITITMIAENGPKKHFKKSYNLDLDWEKEKPVLKTLIEYLVEKAKREF